MLSSSTAQADVTGSCIKPSTRGLHCASPLCSLPHTGWSEDAPASLYVPVPTVPQVGL